LNGKIKSIKNYDKKGNLNGECKIYYENGNLKQIYHYKSANIDGIFQSFYENGHKKRVDYFSKGDFDSGTCWDINGKILKHFDLEKKPEGNIQLISKSLIYPDILRRAGIEEKVIIKILIGTNSEFIKFKYDKNHSKEFINEIIRVLNKPNKLKTAYYEDEPIECWFDLPINFRLK
jgi:antitoxin component YwqK of YwqJK toxin-antitoxin module